MDHINENNNIEDVVNHENPKLEQKNRSNRHHHNGNDLWIHVDAQGADNNKQMTLIAGFSAFAAISLAIVSLFQYEQTSKLVEQNEALKKQYEQTVALMQETNKEAIKELEIGLSSISNSIDKLTIAMQNGTPVVESTPQEQPAEVVVPVDNAAFFGVSIRTDGTEVTPLGLLIDSVYANSPAFTAGLRGGDILMTIDEFRGTL